MGWGSFLVNKRLIIESYLPEQGNAEDHPRHDKISNESYSVHIGLEIEFNKDKVVKRHTSFFDVELSACEHAVAKKDDLKIIGSYSENNKRPAQKKRRRPN